MRQSIIISMNKTLTKKCKICKSSIETNGLIEERSERLLKVGVCSNCDSWLGLWHLNNEEETVRVQGEHYIIGDPQQVNKGLGGREITIEFSDGRIVKTDNLWHQGRVPSDFKNVLGDNAKFLE